MKYINIYLLLIRTGTLFFVLSTSALRAQVVPDITLPVNSKIEQQGNVTFIEGGTRAGKNLFHSLKKLSVPSNQTIYFNNASDIQSIFTRVTGPSLSNIDGFIRANGTANLFLMNPNGIIFGKNASLDIGGSFFATTATRIKFADGFDFNTTDSSTALLTINVPIGLGFTSNTGKIEVKGDSSLVDISTFSTNITNEVFSSFGRGIKPSGLSVKRGKTLGLVAYDLILEGATLTAENGRIELGSVSSDSFVNLIPENKGWVLGYNSAFLNNILFSQGSLVDASGISGGSIQVQGNHVKIIDGSVLVIENLVRKENGVLKINADELEISGNTPNGEVASSIRTNILNGAKESAQAADILVNARYINLREGGDIGSLTSGAAQSGNVILNSESVNVSGFSPLGFGIRSNIFASTLGAGKAGDLIVNTKSLTVAGGGFISTSSLTSGTGGNITVKAKSINLEDPQSFIGTRAFSSGDAGTVKIITDKLVARNGGRIDTSTLASGSAGRVILNADSVELDGTGKRQDLLIPSSINSSTDVPSNLARQVFGVPAIPTGKSGSVTINARKLNVTNGAEVSVKNQGTGDSGTIQINTNTLSLENDGKIAATTASGEGGDITLRSGDIRLRSGEITTSAGESGNGGDIRVRAEIIAALEKTKIRANAIEGRGGNIKIKATGLFLSGDSSITATSERGVDGTVQITTERDVAKIADLEKPIVKLPTKPILCPTKYTLDTREAAKGEFYFFTARAFPIDPTEITNTKAGWHDTSGYGGRRDKENIIVFGLKNYVEAQGWVWNGDGTIRLTQNPSEAVPYSSWGTPKACLQKKTKKKVPPKLDSSDRVRTKIKKIIFKGNTVFKDRELTDVVAPYLGDKISFEELLELRSAITNFYVEKGYVTSGAFIPVEDNQKIQAQRGILTIQIIEGKIEDIKISSSPKLKKYIKRKLKKFKKSVFNKALLLKSLRLLQVDPLIKTISGDLSQGYQQGESVLNLKVKGRMPIAIEVGGDNSRSPTVGRLQRGLELRHNNLIGFGDRLGFVYRNTNGSNIYSGKYSMPINSKDGTIGISYTNVSSKVVERPFNRFDIIGDARGYELSYRQPIVQQIGKKTISEFALGITASRQENESYLLDRPYGLSRGADEKGRTRISALRFFQEWSRKGDKEAFGALTQFSLGVGAFKATINKNEADSRFFTFRGQTAWRKRIGKDSTLFVKADLQIADRPLVALEQFGIGGASTVRGYRQDTFLTDNGFLLSAELRIGVLFVKKSKFYIIPFFDIGRAWNNSEVEEINNSSQQQEGTAASVGIGVEYELEDKLNARLDWGLPLISGENSNSDSWQEKGLNFSIRYRPF